MSLMNSQPVGSGDEIKRQVTQRAGVSAAQQNVVVAEGDMVVLACPGSGKTRTVGTRLVYRMARWNDPHRGIAAISFTNVAIEEITSQVHGLGSTVSYPHFLGTIHSFIDRFIFLPYGHLVMARAPINKRPQLVLDRDEDWVNYKYSLGATRAHITDVHYSADGSLQWSPPIKNANAKQPAQDKLLAVKERLNSDGLASHSDSMYLSLKVLKSYPDIAQAVALRFAELIIDECQDTSDIQWRILRCLRKTGLTTFCLVGDPDQAIFDFQEARPCVLLHLVKKQNWPQYDLDENHRSSQIICNFSRQFSSNPAPINACGPDRACSIHPILVPYPDDDPVALRKVFLSILSDNHIDPANSAILTYTNSVAATIMGSRRSHSWPTTVARFARRLAGIMHRYESGHLMEAIEAICRCMLEVVFDSHTYGPGRSALGDVDYSEWKRSCFRLLRALPTTTECLSDWLPASKRALGEWISDSGWTAKANLPALFRSPKGNDSSNPVSNFVEPVCPSPPIAKTIHSAKGESHEAVMVVASPRVRGRLQSEALDWFQPLEPSGLRPESVRRVYVAVTRPRRLLVLAIPLSAWGFCQDRLVNAEVMQWPGH